MNSSLVDILRVSSKSIPEVYFPLKPSRTGIEVYFQVVYETQNKDIDQIIWGRSHHHEGEYCAMYLLGWLSSYCQITNECLRGGYNILVSPDHKNDPIVQEFMGKPSIECFRRITVPTYSGANYDIYSKISLDTIL